MKRLIPIILLLVNFVQVKAQSGFNYSAFGIGTSFSSIRPYSDLKNDYNDYAYNLNLIYNYNPYLPVSLELQVGKLRGGGNTYAQDANLRRFSNAYKSAVLNADFQIGNILDYSTSDFLNAIKNFYVGTGIGVMINNVDVNRIKMDGSGYRFPGVSNSVQSVIPLRFGYEFKIYNVYDEPVWGIDVAYQHNLSLGGEMDGYNDPNPPFKNNSVDQYRQIKIGVKYNFGYITAWKKQISGYYY